MVERQKEKTLVLLDAHAIIHRAYHALPDFSSSSGEPTGALYGLSAMLISILRELKPDYIVACYDMPKKTFRHEVYKEYKAKRPKLDLELATQINRSRDIFKAFSIPLYEKEGFEADDIIGTIAHEAKKEKDTRVIIASGDMDTLQLADGKKVQVYTLRKGMSDTILYDEAKVEERFGFSAKFLPDFKGLRGDPSDNIVGIKGIGEKTATLLIRKFGSLENMYRALKKDRNLFLKEGLTERVVGLLEEGEEEAFFSKVLAQIRLDAPIKFKVPERTFSETFDPGEARELFSELGFRSLLARLAELFPERKGATENKEIVGEEDLEQTKIALWLLNSNITSPSQDDILRHARAKTFVDAREKILREIKEKDLSRVYEEIELLLMPVLKKASARGILVDVAYLKELSRSYHKELSRLENEIWKLAGEKFNINSPKQLGETLFEKMAIGKGRMKKTSTGALSTRASELEKLKDAHPIVEKILSYREFQKLLSTYIDNLPDMLGEDGRLHTHFIQTGTATGRLASENPNIQNIPVKSELGKNIRKGFIADKGYKLAAFDYSQMELRIAALLSGDETLKKIFKNGHDVHTATASAVFHVPEREVTRDMRRIAKVINFGVIYGMGVTAVQQNIDSTRAEAQKFYADYFETFRGLAEHLEKTKEEARRRGYTETFYGRRRYFPGLKSPLPYIRAMEERMALNAPIQGTSADIVKLAMVRTEARLRDEKLLEGAHLLLQIHDELLYEIKETLLPRALQVIKEEMEGVLIADVAFVVDVSAGYNWGELERVSV